MSFDQLIYTYLSTTKSRYRRFLTPYRVPSCPFTVNSFSPIVNTIDFFSCYMSFATYKVLYK